MTVGRSRGEHIVKQFDSDLESLQKLICRMGRISLQQVRDATRSLVEGSTPLARMVLRREDWVNALEIEADDRFVEFLVTRQPVGPDLRAVLAWGRSVRDLERIGDEAQRIARAALELHGDGPGHRPRRQLLRDVETMSEQAIALVEQSLALLTAPDLERAVGVARLEERLGEEFSASLRRLVTYILEDSRTVGHVVTIALVLRALERVGNHSQNVAAQVIYQVGGRDVRHLRSASERERRLADESE